MLSKIDKELLFQKDQGKQWLNDSISHSPRAFLGLSLQIWGKNPVSRGEGSAKAPSSRKKLDFEVFATKKQKKKEEAGKEEKKEEEKKRKRGRKKEK